MRIANGVEMLEISTTAMGRPGVIHPTLLWDDQHVILVDAGFPGQTPLIRAAIAQAGVDFSRLDTILLTHQDIDHVGGVNGIQAELPGQVEVWAYEIEAPYINGEKTPHKLARLAVDAPTQGPEAVATLERIRSAYANNPIQVDRNLKDGEVLPCCGGIQVIHTPGHTLGHICLYLEAQKILIGGDALAIQGGALAQTPVFLNFDLDLYRESLKKLAGYEIGALVSYHGGLFSGDARSQIFKLALE
jgi:glyoxylase-like metal-dependent hydrolase (beta-lactamase superfamily II)